MRDLNWNDIFVTKDVRKLKERLLNWAKDNPKGVLLFNTTIVSKIHHRMTQQKVSGYQFGNGLKIEDIKITWHKLPGNKGILESITRENTTKEVLYKEPASWEECTLWYEFRLD